MYYMLCFQKLDQIGVYDLYRKLEDPDRFKFAWIKSRLQTLWEDWKHARESLEKKRDLKSYSRKKVISDISSLRL